MPSLRMNPTPGPWIKAFGLISLAALALYLTAKFWLPLLLGALALTWLARRCR
jgi:hypothetical protein